MKFTLNNSFVTSIYSQCSNYLIHLSLYTSIWLKQYLFKVEKALNIKRLKKTIYIEFHPIDTQISFLSIKQHSQTSQGDYIQGRKYRHKTCPRFYKSTALFQREWANGIFQRPFEITVSKRLWGDQKQEHERSHVILECHAIRVASSATASRIFIKGGIETGLGGHGIPE